MSTSASGRAPQSFGGKSSLSRAGSLSLTMRRCISHPLPLGILLLLILCGCGKRFRNESSSMSPTIQKGEIVYVDASAYKTASPGRWDVVVFTHPIRQTLWCARVVGLPGEIIAIEGQGVSINGSVQTQPDGIKSIKYLSSVPDLPATVTFPYTIAAGSYFVLGDNSANAYDSRFWGTVPLANITGRVKGK